MSIDGVSALTSRATACRERRDSGLSVVGARGFEPLTSSVSRKRSPPELSARAGSWIVRPEGRSFEAGTGIEPVYEALQASA